MLFFTFRVGNEKKSFCTFFSPCLEENSFSLTLLNVEILICLHLYYILGQKDKQFVVEKYSFCTPKCILMWWIKSYFDINLCTDLKKKRKIDQMHNCLFSEQSGAVFRLLDSTEAELVSKDSSGMKLCVFSPAIGAFSETTAALSRGTEVKRGKGNGNSFQFEILSYKPCKQSPQAWWHLYESEDAWGKEIPRGKQTMLTH